MKTEAYPNVQLQPALTTRIECWSILYLGVDSGTCRHRAQALRRLGHRVTVVDSRKLLPDVTGLDYWIHHTGALGLEHWIQWRLLRIVQGKRFDVIYVDGGELLSPAVIKSLRACSDLLISYNVDDPFGGRDGAKWRLYMEALPLYDLVVVVRDCNVLEAKDAGAKQVLQVYRAADEQAHAPRALSREEQRNWSSEVAFVGTWMPERSPFLAQLVDLGVPLTIYGDRWQKAKEWPKLSSCWRSSGLYRDDDYRAAILGAKVCLGLLSKGNRDHSTQRSFETPYMGGVLCAERTPEHMKLYEENEEAVFWSTAQECADQCGRLLRDPELRRKIAVNGRQRCIVNGTTNEAVMARILETAAATLRRKQSFSAA